MINWKHFLILNKMFFFETNAQKSLKVDFIEEI